VPSTNATDRPLSEFTFVNTLASVDLITHKLAQQINITANKGNAINAIINLRHLMFVRLKLCKVKQSNGETLVR
jgi:hypothetical protein